MSKKKQRTSLQTISAIHFYLLFSGVCRPQINSTVSMSGLHAVSSSDDVKPPLGLKQLSSHSPGPMLSQKRLCSICGDRSSGEPPRPHHYVHHLGGHIPLRHTQEKTIAAILSNKDPPPFILSLVPQASTMGCTAVRAVKASSSGQYVKI